MTAQCIHYTHHKIMTVYFLNVFNAFAKRYGLSAGSSMATEQEKAHSDLLVEWQHDAYPPRDDHPAGGSHIIRHPKDLLVSAYYYHLRTHESWCHEIPSPYDCVPQDQSYQQALQALDLEQGLLFELWGSTGRTLRHFAQWRYDRPNIMELRYEEVLGNESSTFAALFAWYGFDQEAARTAGELAAARSAARLGRDTSLGQHRRPGSHVGQWREVLPASVNEYMDHTYGQLLLRLGYTY